MSDSQRYAQLARDMRASAAKLERAGRRADAARAYHRAYKYDQLAKLFQLQTSVR